MYLYIVDIKEMCAIRTKPPNINILNLFTVREINFPQNLIKVK